MQTLIASPHDFAAPCRETPEKIALSLLTLSGAERWSYAKLWAECEYLARQLPEGEIFILDPRQELRTPVTMAAALQAGRSIVLQHCTEPQFLGPDLPLVASDRIFLAGRLDEPLLLRAILRAWAAGATVLCPSPKLAPAQWPILMRRHDVTLLAGGAEMLEALWAANLGPLPKLRASFALDRADEALQDTWLARMGQGLCRA